MAQYPAVIELSSLNGINGFRLDGVVAGELSGLSVASAGDVNRDGFADLIIGAFEANPHGASSGASYVVFGQASGFGASLALSSLNGTNGFVINGVAASDQSGFSVASAGDFNGDGKADLIIGARYADPNGNFSGASYVVFGKASAYSANLDLASLDGTNGFAINGIAADDYSGRSVASAGDVNGDGFDDLIVGADGADPHGASSGASYVVFGHASPFPTVSLSGLNGTNGFVINGVATGDKSGSSVASAGDVNGDGLDDLLVGAFGADPHGGASGASYVVFGEGTGFGASIDVSSLDGTNGFAINGVAGTDYSGRSVASAGDFNGDGFEDLIIGAPGVRTNGLASGASYIVFGKTSGFGASIDLSSLNGTNGFVINGGTAADYSGCSVASAGDVNGDGFDDVIVGARGVDPHGSDSGASYVVFGHGPGFPDVALSSLNGTNGFVINGVAVGDKSGFSVASTGDVNGDGLDDLIVGAYRADPSANSDAGSTYVVFGREPDTVVNRTGTVAAQSLIGGAFNDTLSGLGGDDKLFGHAGNDVLNGGAGHDNLNGGVGFDTAAGYGLRADYGIIRGSGTTRVFGGTTGTDTLTSIEKLTFSDTTLYLTQGKGSRDFNGDVNGDLLWQNTSGQASIWLMSGATRLSASNVGTNPGSTWQEKSSGDFDGDGKSDILWQDSNGQAAIWLIDGTTKVTAANAGTNPGTTWHVIAGGDFNGDNKADILWQNTSGQAAVWLMNGTTKVSAANVSANPGTTWHEKAAGDFNGDGMADILWQNTNGQASIWLMNGLTRTAAANAGTNPGSTWQVKGSGDFNDDGKADILWQNTNGQAAVWLMDGTAKLSAANVGTNPGTTWHVIGAQDLDSDGKSDIVWQNDSGQASAWFMNGTTKLSAANIGTNPGASWHLVT